VEDFVILDANVQVFDFKQCHHSLPLFLVPRERRRRASKRVADNPLYSSFETGAFAPSSR